MSPTPPYSAELFPDPTIANVGEEDVAPRVRQALGPDWPADHPDAGGDDRPLRVLCVDDLQDAADATAAVLELLGCEVRACYDGPSALAAVPDFRPDVCVIDLSMPGMDGIQLATRLRAAAGSRPLFLVAATALGELEDRTLTALTGFHFHLVKPVPHDALRRAIDDIRAVARRPRRRP